MHIFFFFNDQHSFHIVSKTSSTTIYVQSLQWLIVNVNEKKEDISNYFESKWEFHYIYSIGIRISDWIISFAIEWSIASIAQIV